MTAATSPHASSGPPRSMISPVVDFLGVGGLSILVLLPLLASGRSDLVMIGAGAQAWIATAINMPHFMASYRLVYRNRQAIVEHKWASIYVPLLLLAAIAIAVWEAQRSPVFVIVLVTVSSVYLAWHYTGQVWGMMASYAHLRGVHFDDSERRLIRLGLRILLAWHMTWFLYTQLRDPARVRAIYAIVSLATVAAFALGVTAFLRMRRRTGALPPMLALVPWLSLFVWYAAMARDSKAIFWVQIAHALQYLAFPVRVEINQTVERSPTRVAAHMVGYAVVLLVVSVVVGQLVPIAMMGAVGRVLGEEPGRVAPVLLLMFINIHHYFTDGVLWKLRNPAVRHALFAHAERSGGAPNEAGPSARGSLRVSGRAKAKE